MMGVAQDSIASQLGELTKAVDAPTGDLGYGVDLSCVTDITPRLDEVRADSVLAIGQALLRRLITPHGVLVDDQDYGLDVRSFCNRGTTVQELVGLGDDVRDECMKDDRVADATVTVGAAGAGLSVTLAITPTDPAVEDFKLTLAVTSTEVLTNIIT
jgi:hypothetical protein